MSIPLLSYKGIWNGYLNSPGLSDGSGELGAAYLIANNNPDNGQQLFIVNRDLGSGTKSWLVSQYIYYDGSQWQPYSPSTGGGSGTVTSVDGTGGTGIMVTGGPITTSGSLTITNTAPDQVVDISGGTGIQVLGTYPNFTINAIGGGSGTVTSITAGTGLSGGVITTSGTISMPNTGTAGTYGDATHIPVFTTDAQGRVTSVTNTAISGSTGTVTSINISGSTGILATGGPITTNGVITVTNTLPDLTVALSGSTGIAISGVYPNFVITNTSPATGNYITALTGDITATGPGSVPATIGANKVTYAKMQAVSTTSRLLGSSSTTTPIQELSIGSGLLISGSTLVATDAGGTVTSINISGSTGISASGGPVTTSGVITVTNTAPDQLVTLSGSTGISTSGTYPNFVITNTAPSLTSGTVTNVSSANGAATITNPTTTPQITINSAPKWTTARNLAGNSVDGSVDVSFANKFIVQGTTDAGLSGAQFLGALATGIVKNTTITGVLSIATAGTDYVAPSTTVNGHALSSNVIVNLSELGDVNISSPANHNILEFLTADNKWHAGTAATGTVTSINISGSTGISASGGPITSSGTIVVTNTAPDLTVQLSGSTGIAISGTYPSFVITNTAPNVGSGTVTSVGLSLPTELTVTNSPVTTTGTLTGAWASQTANKFLAAPSGAPGTPSFRVIATPDLGTGTANSGTYLRGDLTWAAVSASPGGSTTQVQYNNAGTTDGATNVTIDLTDERLILLSTSGTTVVASPSSGLKVWGDNRAGFDQPHFTPTVGIDYWLQPSIGQKVISQYSFGTTVSGTGAYNSSSAAGTTAEIVKTYDATNLLPNYSYRRITTAASGNSSAEFFVNATGRGPTMGNNVYGGGFKFMATFGFPTYLATERIFIGVTGVAAQNATTTDPSAWLNMLGVAKDAADTTLQFMTNAGSGTATKTNTGLTPNANDVFRMTLYVPSNSANAYILLEQFSKSAVTIADTSFTGAKLMGGLLVYTHLMVNTGAVASAIQIAIMNQQLEEF